MQVVSLVFGVTQDAVQKITTGALGFELAAVGILGSTAVAYDYLSSQDSYY